MSSDQLFTKTRELVFQALELEQQTDFADEAALLDYIGDAVAWYLEKRLEYLMQILYMMDVDEQILQRAFSFDNPEPANISIAKAILARQKKRAETKLNYKSQNKGDFFDVE